MKRLFSSISGRIMAGLTLIAVIILCGGVFTLSRVAGITDVLGALQGKFPAGETIAELAAVKGELAVVSQSQIVAMALAVLMVATVALVFIRSIATPLRRVIGVIEKIGQGDTSERLPMGKPVNCSSIKNCGKQDCPSYGKIDPCWVTSGSYAVIKHCPKAQQGMDCRECDLYGAHNEMEELGSILAALADNLELRKQLATKIAAGDLSHQVEIASDKDALGQSLQKMTESLRQIIGQVQAASLQVSAGSHQIASASQTLSDGATRSAASLEQVSSSMGQISHQVQQSSEHAAAANELTAEMRSVAEAGNQRMGNMIESMGEINQSAQNISKIIKVIDEIAFQTNLLALNAAVEAARAGQHGKGFAVVAEEVRNLAARSAKAARETTELIEGSVASTGRGTQIAEQTADALGAIVQSINKVSDLVAEINQASGEQAQGIMQINIGLEQIDRVIQDNSANAEEGASSSEELAAQAEELTNLLSRFNLSQQASLPRLS